MQLLYEILPVFLFFITFKFYNIYLATIVGIAATFLQVLLTRVFAGRWDKKQVVTLAVFVFFGGLTLYFHNPIFVKWKPTIIFWIFAIIILGSRLFAKQPLIQRMMMGGLDPKYQIPVVIWQRLNTVWALFFAIMGAVNLYIAYFYSNDAWVNFKFYGITSALLVFSVGQAIYLSKHMSEVK